MKNAICERCYFSDQCQYEIADQALPECFNSYEEIGEELLEELLIERNRQEFYEEWNEYKNDWLDDWLDDPAHLDNEEAWNAMGYTLV